MTYRLEWIESEKMCRFQGVKFAGKLEVLAFNKRTSMIAIKKHGGNVWNGIGMPRAYHATSIAIYHLTPIRGRNHNQKLMWEAEEVLEWNTRPKVIGTTFE